jgi:SAM-dependent methyltransferase
MTREVTKVLTWPEYYERRLSQTTPEAYLQEKRLTRWATIAGVVDHTAVGGRVLEAGCGTSVLSVELSRRGYFALAVDHDSDMLSIAVSLSSGLQTQVPYTQADIFNLPFKNNSIDTVFSHGVLEHFDEEGIANALLEGLRVADCYVISVPSLFNRARDLRGDENLWTVHHWRQAIALSGGRLKRVYAMYSKRPRRETINLLVGARLTWMAPNLVFVVTS